VSGAGGGGFIMFLVDPDRRAAVTRAVSARGFVTTSARFTNDGCAIWESPSTVVAAHYR
jgi:D-glycero-alpha-D-manno-heptose-7-phosphate kinase